MPAIGVMLLLWAGPAVACTLLFPEPPKHCTVRRWGQVQELCDRSGCTAVVSPGKWRFRSDRSELIAILGGRAVIQDFTLVTPRRVLHPSAALSADQVRHVPRGPCGGRYEEGWTNNYRRVGIAPEGLVMEAMQDDGPPVRVLLDAIAGVVKPWSASADGCRGLRVSSERDAWWALAVVAGQVDFTREPERGPVLDGDRSCMRVLGQLASRNRADSLDSAREDRLTQSSVVAEEWLRVLGRRSWRSARFVSGLSEPLRPELTAHFCVLSRRFQLSMLLLALLPIGAALLRSKRVALALGALTLVALLSALTSVPSLYARWNENPQESPDPSPVMRQALKISATLNELEEARCPLESVLQNPKPPSTSMVRPVK